MKKILALILAISLIAGCIGGKPGTETGKGIDSGKTADKVSNQENVKIDSIIFTRTGAQVNLKEEAHVTSANAYDNNTKIASQNVNSKAKEVFIDFNWEPKKQYKIEVQTSNGVASSSVYAPAKPTALKIGEIKLEDVEVIGSINTTYDIIWGEVRYSPDGKYLVVGTFTGYIKAIETATNKIVFEKKIAEGRIMSFDFSSDSKYLVLGDKSVDGYVYAFELSSGKEIWKFRTGDEIGSDIKDTPGIQNVIVRGNVAYALAFRTASGPDMNYHWTRIYAFDIESGRVSWRYPENEVMDIRSTWMDVSSDGKYIVFETNIVAKAGKRGERKYKGDEVVVLNGEGKKLWSYEKPILPYFESVISFNGASFSKDGKYLTGADGGGVGYLFNNEDILKSGKASPLWNKNISTAIEISGVPIHGWIITVRIVGDNVLFLTGSSGIPAKAKSAKYTMPPIKHPNGNMVLVYNLKGDILWKWRLEGYSGKAIISKDERFLVFPVAMDTVTHNIDVHGVYVFDNAVQGGATSKLAYIYKTRGITVNAAISPDGKYIAAIESPTRLEDGTVIGEYKVHILS